MFLVRSSVSRTRKLFQRTIQSVKSLFTERTTYQRLPKFPPFKHFSSQSYRELDRFYSEFTNEIDVEDNVVVSAISPQDEILHRKLEEIRDDHEEEEEKNRLIAYEEMLEKNVMERRCLVTKKLKDLKMVDSNDLDDVQDIEEVLHLYSLLTCPVYIDMLDQFVMSMYSDIFNLKASSNQRENSIISSRSRLRHSSFLRDDYILEKRKGF